MLTHSKLFMVGLAKLFEIGVDRAKLLEMGLDRSKSVSSDWRQRSKSLSSDWHKSAKARIGRNIVVDFLVSRAAPRPPTARENNGISPCFTSAAENSGALEIESLDSDWPSGVSDSEQIA